MIRYATLFIFTIMIFIIFNLMIYQKQKLLKSGETIYFSITPSDPRSIMQGDYMTFRYKLENDLKNANDKVSDKKGYVVIAFDDKSVGHFVRFYQGEQLAPNERLLRFRHRLQGGYRIQPNTFFFQEKLQPYFQQAEYAIFHYNGDKNYLLVGLANKNKERIEPQQ
ncbi:MAG: GDYXXLXY domain-containing protein [Candidatus Berkiella sp.]